MEGDAEKRPEDWRERLHAYVPRDWVFPIVLAAFVAVVVWFARDVHDFLAPADVTVEVPSFVGETIDDAQAEVTRLHLAASVVERAMSDRFPRDVVMLQRPEAGTHVRQGRVVSFVVSNGAVPTLMPDVRYESIREAQLDLARAKVALGKITYQRSDTVPEGSVIGQNPPPLINVTQGGSADLVVSRGAPRQLMVPNFTGMTIDAARDLAARGAIKLGQIVWTPLGRSGPAHGQVVRQTPKAGTRIGAFDPVSLQVSAGPNESGYILRQVHLLVSVPEPQGAAPSTQVHLRVTVTDATGRYNLFVGFALVGQKLDFTVSALGTSVVDLYVNDVLAGERRLGEEPPRVYNEKPKPLETP